MKTLIAVTFLLYSFLANASIKIVINGKTISCQKLSTEDYRCPQDDETILLKDSGFGFSGAAIKKNSFPRSVEIDEVYEDQQLIFSSKKSSSLARSAYDTSGSDTVSKRLFVAKNLIDEWSDSKVPEAQALVLELKQYIAKNSEARDKLRVEGDQNQRYDCERIQSKSKVLKCSLFSCKNEKNEKSIGLIPELGSFNGFYILTPNKDRPRVETQGLRVFDSKSSDHIPLYDFPREADLEPPPPAQSEQRLFPITTPVPHSFKGSEESFRFFSDFFSISMFDSELEKCVPNQEQNALVQSKREIQEKISDEIANIELGHYLTLVNGRILSMAVDADKLKSMGCLYNGMVLSESMVSELNFLERAKPRPIAKYLTSTEAQELFKRAKSMDDIPFDFKYDGCYARAHVMARRFEKMGIPVEKVWIKGNLSVPGTDIEWNYHVAPVVNVKDESGKIVKYVIDPSLNDKAVPVDTWVASMSHNVKGKVVQTAYPFPSNIALFQRTAVAYSSSDVYMPDNDQGRSEEDNMKLAVETLADYTKVLKNERKK